MASCFERFARRAAALVVVVGLAIILASAAVAQTPNPNLPPLPTPPPNETDIVRWQLENNPLYRAKCRTDEVEEAIKYLQGRVEFYSSQISELKSQISDLLVKGGTDVNKTIVNLKERIDYSTYMIAAANYLIAVLNAKPPCVVTPPPPPPPPPVSHAVPSVPHVMTLCEKCQPYADAYNKAADSYAAAVRLHDPDQAVFRQQMEEAQRNLTNCENTCAPLEVPPPQTPPEHSMVVPPATTGTTLVALSSPFVFNGYYIGLSGGPSFVPTVTATEFFNDGKDRFPWGSSTGSYFGAQVGGQFGNWRAEGQYTWSVNPAAATMPVPGIKIGGDTETFGFFGNVIYTPPFSLGIPVTPHLGVGFGALSVTTDIKVNDRTVFNSSGWAPGAQAIGGVTYNISPTWSVDLNYQYQTTLTDVEYRTLPIAGSDIRNRVTSPYHAHFITLGVNLHFPVATVPPPGAAIPQARQVASLTPVETAAVAAHRFTLRYDEANAVLTPASVRALHEALDAINSGQSVQIAIAGCETDGDYSNGSLCTHRTRRIQHLLARYGVENPGQLLVRGL